MLLVWFSWTVTSEHCHELEQKVVKQFTENKIVMFYDCYVDNALVAIKHDDLNNVHNSLNNLDHSLNFTLDNFSNVFLHFLGIEIHSTI